MSRWFPSQAGVLYDNPCQGNQIPQEWKHFRLPVPVVWFWILKFTRGRNRFTDQRLGIGRNAVAWMALSFPRGAHLYFDRYFTSVILLDMLKGRGTIMKNRIKVSDDTKLQKQGRDASETVVRKPSEAAVTKWWGYKALLIASSVHGTAAWDGHRKRSAMLLRLDLLSWLSTAKTWVESICATEWPALTWCSQENKYYYSVQFCKTRPNDHYKGLFFILFFFQQQYLNCRKKKFWISKPFLFWVSGGSNPRWLLINRLTPWRISCVCYVSKIAAVLLSQTATCLAAA